MSAPEVAAEQLLGPRAPEEPLSKLERTRLKNSKAQQKYRQKKKEEKRQLHQEAAELAMQVAQAEADRDALRAEVNELQTRLQAGGEQPQAAAASSTVQEDAPYCPAEEGFEGISPTRKTQGLVLQAAFQPPRRFSHEEALSISVREHCEIRKEMVLKAGQLLLSNPERDPDNLEGKQLQALMREFHGLVAYLAVYHPTMLYKLNTVHGQSLGPIPAGSGPWISILRKLRLSREQEDYLLALMSECETRKQALMLERRLLHQALSVYVDSASAGAQGGGGEAGDLNHVYFASLVRRLRDSVDGVHVEQCKFFIKSSSTWAHHLPPASRPQGLGVWQDAQLLTLAWPYFPSKLLLGLEVAKLRGCEPSGGGVGPGAEPAASGAPEAAADDEPYKPVPFKIIEEYLFQQKLQLGES